MSIRIRRSPLLIALFAFAGAVALAGESAPPVAAGPVVEASESAIANFSLSGIRLTNTAEAGVPAATAEAFQTELARRLAERAASEPGRENATKGTVEVRIDQLTVQGDFTRGKEGDPIPRDLFAATVRVLDDAGQEISLYVIPETQIRDDKLTLDRDKLLGVEGAAIVYRKLFGAR